MGGTRGSVSLHTHRSQMWHNKAGGLMPVTGLERMFGEDTASKTGSI